MSWTIACFCGHLYTTEGDCPSCGRALYEPAMPPPLPSCGDMSKSAAHHNYAPFVNLARYGAAAQRRHGRIVPRPT